MPSRQLLTSAVAQSIFNFEQVNAGWVVICENVNFSLLSISNDGDAFHQRNV